MSALYSIVFGISFYLQWKKYGINCATFILLLYFVSSILSLLLLFVYDNYNPDFITFSSVVYHLLCLFLWMYPVIFFLNRKSDTVIYPLNRKIDYFSWFIIALSVFCIVSSIGFVISLFHMDLAEARALLENDDVERKSYGIISYLGNLAPAIAIVPSFLLFYYLAYRSDKKLIIWLLLISSFAIVVSNLTTMGRDGFIRWAFNMIFSFLFFQKKLCQSMVKRIKKLAVVICVFLFILFISISTARFGESDEGLLYSLCDYGGQNFIYFSYGYDYFFDGAFNGRMTFPVFFREEEWVSMLRLNDRIYAPYKLNTFSTFIGTFYLDMGWYVTLFFSLFIFIFNLIFLILRKKVTFVNLIYVLFLFQIISLGLFYYMYYNPTSLKSMLLINFLSLLLYFRILREHKNMI